MLIAAAVIDFVFGGLGLVLGGALLMSGDRNEAAILFGVGAALVTAGALVLAA